MTEMAVYHQFHDGYLVGIAIDHEQREIELRIATHPRASRVRLIGVEQFLANEVKEGNIILVVEVISGAEIRQAHLVMWLGELVTAESNDEWFERIVARIEQEELAFFVLQGSYGADVFCVCQRVDVVEDVAA